MVDNSRIGLYFHDEQPGNFYRQSVVIDPTIQIHSISPAAEVAYYEFDKPALLHDLVHSHYRGVASKFELIGPTAAARVLVRTQLRLQLAAYPHFCRAYAYRAWQPLGSHHLVRQLCGEPRQSGPESHRTLGLQSWDEMLYGAFSYTLVDETSEAILDKALADTTQMVGFLDKDMDGKLSWQEPVRIKRRLVQGFKMVDSNADGGLDIKELYGLSKRRGQQAQSNDASTEAGGG